MSTVFSEDLKAWMKLMDFSQSQAAKELETPLKTLQAWYQGIRVPTLDDHNMAIVRRIIRDLDNAVVEKPGKQAKE